MKNLLKSVYIQLIMMAVLLIPAMAWASETEKHVWIPPIGSVIPFVILLLCIAFLPLIKFTQRWWENNSNRALIAAISRVFKRNRLFLVYAKTVVALGFGWRPVNRSLLYCRLFPI